MVDEDRDGAPRGTAKAAGGPVTPGDVPSALERGARIIERLRRRAPSEPTTEKRDESRLR